MKVIHRQSFTIFLSVYTRKYSMIIVNTSQLVMSLILKTISHTSSFKSITKILKNDFKNAMPHIPTSS